VRCPYCGVPTAVSLLPCPYCGVPTAVSLLRCPYCRVPTAVSLLRCPYCRVPTAVSLLPCPYCRVPTAVSLRLFAPLIIAWKKNAPSFYRQLQKHYPEATIILFLVVVVSQIVFGKNYPLEFGILFNSLDDVGNLSLSGYRCHPSYGDCNRDDRDRGIKDEGRCNKIRGFSR